MRPYLAFERYSYAGGNRVSLNITLFQNDKDLAKKTSYTVGEATREENGTYQVVLTVKPITLLKDTYAEFQEKAQQFVLKCNSLTFSTIHPQRKFKAQHLQIHRMYGLLRKVHLPGRQAEQHF